MIRKLICCLLLALSSLAQNNGNARNPQESKLLVLEHLWNEAQVNRDSSALAGMIADRFINTEYDGEVSDRGKFLADIADPQFKPTFLNIRDVKINLYRDTAVVAGIYHAKGTYQGRPYEHVGRFTDTWVLDNGKWECVASHTSLLKK
jgi:ketosteroid isomerase-like protein